ncbi:hypothetical protein MMC21_000163 [Puttea exsequens]|nr:hypothetical protein [Puttea exsequens]
MSRPSTPATHDPGESVHLVHSKRVRDRGRRAALPKKAQIIYDFYPLVISVIKKLLATFSNASLTVHPLYEHLEKIQAAVALYGEQLPKIKDRWTERTAAYGVTELSDPLVKSFCMAYEVIRSIQLAKWDS